MLLAVGTTAEYSRLNYFACRELFPTKHYPLSKRRLGDKNTVEIRIYYSVDQKWKVIWWGVRVENRVQNG